MFSSPGSQVQSLFIPLFLPQIRGKIPELLSHHFISSCLSYAAIIIAWQCFSFFLLQSLKKYLYFFSKKTRSIRVLSELCCHYVLTDLCPRCVSGCVLFSGQGLITKLLAAHHDAHSLASITN